ncbi:hypothetical protein O181_002916 [Austropuccinia psidii MF-1]|uniref:Uncharacterized protein n=1 Tax=Austropuccinia psidii MF-1 TaxID=1389203 RepID=A0A9Q3BCT8_9BASI|nr:hypothetical protein [Austropuccinia psidii MF-1]
MAGLQLDVTSSIESGLQTLALYICEYQLNSMGDDLTSTDEYDEKDLFNGTASGAANSVCINDDRHQVKPQKRRRIQSDVYEYYEIAALATNLYFERKQKLIEEVANLPQGTYLSAAIDCWTTKDQTQSYVAMVGQWVDPIKYTFWKCLLSFETITGVHTGKALAWSVWESLSERGMVHWLYSITGDNAANNLAMAVDLERKFHGVNIKWPPNSLFHRCACHVLNLVAKDFLSHMGELTDEDYELFDDYLSLERAPIKDSEDEHPPMAQELQGSIKRAGNSYHCTSRKCRNRAFNEVTLETQDKSEALHRIMANNSSCRVDSDSEIMPSVQPPAGRTIVRALRDLCSHIRGSGKQRDLFIQARNKTRDPKILPINIPMTRWNFFLHQIQRAQRLKLSIQLYTSTPDGKNYYLSKKIWSSMEFMEPILVLFEKACNVFQSKSPTKHLVLPYYQVIMKRLEHYAHVSPITWCQACEAAQAKLQKYYDLEVKNDDTLIATLLNPRYCEGIFAHLKVPASRANAIVGQLMNECATMTCIRDVEMEDPADLDSSD